MKKKHYQNRNKVYTNGYMGKIEYWQSQYESALSEDNLNGVIRALDKLIYFVQRQKDTYGHIGVGNVI